VLSKSITLVLLGGKRGMEDVSVGPQSKKLKSEMEGKTCCVLCSPVLFDGQTCLYVSYVFKMDKDMMEIG